MKRLMTLCQTKNTTFSEKQKSDTHSEHVANFGKQEQTENRQQPLTEEEINNTQIYIPGIDGKPKKFKKIILKIK